MSNKLLEELINQILSTVISQLILKMIKVLANIITPVKYDFHELLIIIMEGSPIQHKIPLYCIFINYNLIKPNQYF